MIRTKIEIRSHHQEMKNISKGLEEAGQVAKEYNEQTYQRRLNNCGDGGRSINYRW